MIYYETRLRFKREYKEYIFEKHSHLQDITKRQYYAESFNEEDNDKGVDFWESLTDPYFSTELKTAIKDFWLKWTMYHSENALSDNHSNYISSFERVEAFVNQNETWKKTIKHESLEVSKKITEIIVKNQELSDKEIKIILQEEIGPYDIELEYRISNYRYLSGKENSTDRLRSDVIFPFLDSFSDNELDFALSKIKKKIIEDYINKYYDYRHLISSLNDYAVRRKSSIDFPLDLFKQYKCIPEYDLNKSAWLIFGDKALLDEKSWVNDEKKLNMRKEIIPIGAKIILVEKIVINDEMSKFFDNGLIIHAEGKVIENKPNENMLKFEWEEKHLNKLWYHNLFENNLSFVSKNGKSVNARNFANFIFDGVPQDLDYYIKKYGKVQSKIDLIDDESSINNEVPNNNTYTKDDFLLEVFIDSQEYEKLKDLIYDKQNLILQGAPGVGKTYMAKRLAYSLIGEVNNKYLLQLQFHQSYSYEDLIMGYRPFGNNFKLVKGPFYSFIKQAINDQNSDYFIIIDEINRGNISKIFGELLMLIEADKRGEANAIKLMYSNEDFYIPRNIYILGMMNTADRSLALIDYALRRRFVFYTMKPAFDNITFQEMLKGTKNINLMRLVEGIKELNKEIRSDDSLGQGFEIGHSYFTRNYEVNNSQVKNIIDFEIEPLLREYWYDDEHKIERHLRLLLGKMHE